MKKLIIYGSNNFAKIVANLARNAGFEVIGFIDDYRKGPEILGDFNYVSTNYSIESYSICIAIGYNYFEERKEIFKKIKKVGYALPNIVHPNSVVSDNCSFGEGNIVMDTCSIGFSSIVKNINIFWPGTIISHDNIIKDNNFFSPNSTLCGFVKISGNCFIGAGSTIVDNTEIAFGSFIKAGELHYTRKDK